MTHSPPREEINIVHYSAVRQAPAAEEPRSLKERQMRECKERPSRRPQKQKDDIQKDEKPGVPHRRRLNTHHNFS